MSVDSFERLEEAVQRAENLRRQGDLAGAYQSYLASLLQRVTQGNTLGLTQIFSAADVVIADRVVELAVLFGRAEGADHLLTGLATLFEQAGNRFSADYTTLRRVDLALQCGRLRDASAQLRSMQPVLGDLETIPFDDDGLETWERERQWPDTDQGDRAVLFSRIYLAMGSLLAALGQYGDALAALRRGLVYTGPEAPDLARQADLRLRLAIAAAHLERSDLATADRTLAGVEYILNEELHPGYSVRWLELSGKTHLLRGEFGVAIERFERVLEICGQRRFERAYIQASLNLAHVLIFLNHTAAARTHLETTQQRAMDLGEMAAAARADYLIGLSCARGQAMADGVPLAHSVYETWHNEPQNRTDAVPTHRIDPFDLPQSSNYLAFFDDQALGFQWELGQQQDLSASAEALQRLQTVFAAADSQLIQVRLRVMEGMLAYYQGSFDRAEAILLECQPVLQRLGLKPELWQLQRILNWCWIRQGRPQAQRQAIIQVTEALLTEMTQSLQPVDQAVFLLNKWTVEEEAIAGMIDRLAHLKQESRGKPWFLRPQLHRQILEGINSLLHHIDRHKDALAKRAVNGEETNVDTSRVPSLGKRLLTHPRDAATISFLVLPDRILVVQTGWLHLNFGVSPLTRLQLRDSVRAWHEQVRLTTGSPREASPLSTRHLGATEIQDQLMRTSEEIARTAEQRVQEISSQLAETLQLPEIFDTLPHRVRRLTFVPDDCLHGFSFSSLLHLDQYLVQKYTVTVAFESMKGRQQKRRVPCTNALLVGVSRGARGVPPLPGALREIEIVDTWLRQRRSSPSPNTTITKLINDDADRKAVTYRLTVTQLAHMACHGMFEHERPDQTGLVLLPRSDCMEILSLRDIAGLKFDGLQHIGLSSCWSADHFILPGRWVVGLPETFWRSGAESILGSLWSVDDQVAVTFMTRFYHYADSHPLDEALRRAQQDCLRRDLPGCQNISTEKLFYWAGYHLYGSNLALRFD